MNLVERPGAGRPGPGQVLVAPEAVGICGSDYHFFSGELSDAAGGSQFPRVQGHEVGRQRSWRSATAARPELSVGQRVALLPLTACGHCYPCSLGRTNACVNFQLIGIHRDGGLQELLSIAQEQVFPVDADDGAIAAMVEPVSIAVRAVRRGRIGAGERVVVMGAGPIGQCVCLVALERGAEVLAIDVQPDRLAVAAALGAHDAERGPTPRRWSPPPASGPAAAVPPVGVDATGVPAAVRATVDMVASAGTGRAGRHVHRRGLAADRQPDREGA